MVIPLEVAHHLLTFQVALSSTYMVIITLLLWEV